MDSKWLCSFLLYFRLWRIVTLRESWRETVYIVRILVEAVSYDRRLLRLSSSYHSTWESRGIGLPRWALTRIFFTLPQHRPKSHFFKGLKKLHANIVSGNFFISSSQISNEFVTIFDSGYIVTCVWLVFALENPCGSAVYILICAIVKASLLSWREYGKKSSTSLCGETQVVER